MRTIVSGLSSVDDGEKMECLVTCTKKRLGNEVVSAGFRLRILLPPTIIRNYVYFDLYYVYDYTLLSTINNRKNISEHLKAN